VATLLLTGATGYLGAAVFAALKCQGADCDRLHQRLENLEPGALARYDRVIHAAGAPRYRGQPAIDTANRVGTERLLAALAPDAAVLFISSRLVYGHQSGRRCSENEPTVPGDDYGRAKLAAEQAVSGSGHEHVILRIPGLIGDSPAGIGHNFLAHALQSFFRNREVIRHVPDRIHDNLDVQALAQLCAAWGTAARRLPAGVSNLGGTPRSLHGTLAAFALEAERHGAWPTFIDQVQPEMPWPLMDDQRLREAVGEIRERSDEEIAAACWAYLRRAQE
jgi:nucleoside-diphosphate-sugar epimerase